jgi:hypothetical protein
MSFRTFDLGFKTWMRLYFVGPRTGNEDTMRSSRFWRDSGLSLERATVGSWIAVGAAERWLQRSAGVPLMFLGAGEETEMDANYVFLCGVMWCRFGQQDAGKELLRATNSVDPNMKALAWAMLAKGARRLRDLETPTPTGSRTILEGNLCG